MAADDNFFSRWSRRKVAVVKGTPLAEPVAPVLSPVRQPSPQAGAAQTVTPVDVPPLVPGVYVPPQVSMTGRPAAITPSSADSVSKSATEIESPPLTLDDVRALSAESDFKPFIAKNVAPDVRNAAMKKLFTDPHYNVMDRLDIYIDDYSLPDPLPESMLRQMASAKFLNLFDDEDAETAPPVVACATPPDATLVATPVTDAVSPDAPPDLMPFSAAIPAPLDNAPAADVLVSAVLTPSIPAASPAANLAS